MRKLFLFIALLMLSAGLWAETQSVNYIDADGQQKTVTATVVTNETGTLSNGWYVVLGEVSRGSITCKGAVHLILADGTKLTATGGEEQAGITVSGEGNSLTIYGQTNQSGQLFARGGNYGAGIGGGQYSSGSAITINGGTVAVSHLRIRGLYPLWRCLSKHSSAQLTLTYTVHNPAKPKFHGLASSAFARHY